MVYRTLRLLSDSLSNIRNVGIIAHIDAGKTTTTERMLYYSGLTRYMGDVDSGDTITDHMDQERERGISIVSAAVTLPWRGSTINLVDTPGHVDFAVEVERCLCVLDGAVTVLDGCRGVEAQTLTVWRQAARHAIPQIVYVNKMDRKVADFISSINSVKSRFPDILALPIHTPYYNSSNKFQGVIDPVQMKLKTWNLFQDPYGNKFEVKDLHQEPLSNEFEQALHERERLLEALIEVDPLLAENYLKLEEPAKILSESELMQAIRRCTLSYKAVPVLCGSSRHNIGVQPLMDAVLDYLPSPVDRLPRFLLNPDYHPQHQRSVPRSHLFSDKLRAMAFKSVIDKQRGPLTFARIYTGHVSLGEDVRNATRDTVEKVQRIIEINSDHYKEISKAGPGQIVALQGLNGTYTGDFLTSRLTNVEAKLEEQIFTASPKHVMKIPEPVVFCSVEPDSLSQANAMSQVLEWMQKEDPSFKSYEDEQTGQTIICGLGDLHLEVMTERMRREHKLKVSTGPIFINYRETLLHSDHSETISHSVTMKLNGRELTANVKLSLSAMSDDNHACQVDHINSQEFIWSHADRYLVRAVEQGVRRGLLIGPLLRCPVLGCMVHLHEASLSPPWFQNKSALTLVRSCAAEAVRKGINQFGSVLMEPVMKLEITIPQEGTESEVYFSRILNEFNKRRVRVDHIEDSSVGDKLLQATAPLAELIGFSSTARQLTSGRVAFHMELDRYEQMQLADQEQAIRHRKYGQ